MIQSSDHGKQQAAETFDVKILRQQAPGEPSYWERHRVVRQHDMNVISVLQEVAAEAKTVDGQDVSPVAWDCNCLEEVCGACTMVINGRVRQACSALVDRLLEDKPGEIVLEPMTKFPVVRDLLVDRSRMFEALKRVHAWIDVDGYYDAGPGPRQSQDDQESAYPLSQCMSCGCCLEACPQYSKIELERLPEETDEQFAERKQAAYRRGFVGAAAISQAVLFNTHPTGKMQADQRLDSLMESGGIQVCGNAQKRSRDCPKEIPLTRSIARIGRSTTIRAIKKFFER